MIQYSDVKGGKNDAASVDIRSGTLLIKNERRTVIASFFSLRNVALANISKDARIRSIVVVCKSP